VSALGTASLHLEGPGFVFNPAGRHLATTYQFISSMGQSHLYMGKPYLSGTVIPHIPNVLINF
jgi:hypothetical protein